MVYLLLLTAFFLCSIVCLVDSFYLNGMYRKNSCRASLNNPPSRILLDSRHGFDDRFPYEGNMFTNKFPVPMKANSQRVMLKWFCMLRKLREVSYNCSLSDISQRTGLSCDMIAALISMAEKLEVTLIWANMRLVHHIARTYQGSGVELDDLIAEGVKGLRRAVERFDSSRGYTLSTYAVPWIKEYIRNALASANPITLPRSVHKLLVKVRGVRERLFITLGRVPSDEDLAEDMGIHLDRLEIVKRALALESRIREGEMQGEQELSDFEEENKEPAKEEILNSKIEQVRSSLLLPADSVNLREVRDAVLQAIATLPEEEAKAIYLRLGLGQSDSAPTVMVFADDTSLPTKEELQFLYHKGVRRLRRRATDPRYPAVNVLGVIFRDGQVKQKSNGQEFAKL